MAEQNRQKLTEESIDRIQKFVEDNDLNRMSRNLRKIFFDYLRQQQAGLDIEFNEVLNDVEYIIELLEYIHLSWSRLISFYRKEIICYTAFVIYSNI